MAKGFDTTANCAGVAAQLKAAGYDFVGRYYAHTGSKRLSAAEAKAGSGAGLQLVTVWEAAPTTTRYFSRARGIDEGTSAYHAALLGGQPAGSAIYFAVDYDAPQAAIAGAIADYFRGIGDVFAAIAGNTAPAYRIGVYGSRASCSAMIGHGLARLSWLAQSTGWLGYGSYSGWNIKKGGGAPPFWLGGGPHRGGGGVWAFLLAGFLVWSRGAGVGGGVA